MIKQVLTLTPILFLTTVGVCQAQKPVTEVQVAPAATTIRVGVKMKLTPTAYDRGGNVIPTGVRYLWSSNNVNVARVESTGTVTAVAVGSAVITAEAVSSGTPPTKGAAVITVRR